MQRCLKKDVSSQQRSYGLVSFGNWVFCTAKDIATVTKEQNNAGYSQIASHGFSSTVTYIELSLNEVLDPTDIQSRLLLLK